MNSRAQLPVVQFGWRSELFNCSKTKVNGMQRLFSREEPRSFTSQYQPRLVHNISQQIIKYMRFLSKSYKVGKLALHARHGVFSLFQRSLFGRQSITQARSAAERLSDEILVIIFEEVSPLYSERSPKSDEAFCFRTGRISKSSKLTACAAVPDQPKYSTLLRD